MWWFLKKITDNEQAIEYSYGCLSEKRVELSDMIKSLKRVHAFS